MHIDFNSLIPLIVPVVLALLKQVLPQLPKTVVPILAPLLGAGLDIGDHFLLSSDSLNPQLGAAYGLIGIGIREILDQLLKAIGFRSAGKVAGMLLAIGLSAALLTQGCATFAGFNQAPTDQTKQDEMWAGDLGAAVCLGAALSKPELTDKARLGAAAARVLLQSEQPISVYWEPLVEQFPEKQRPVISVVLQRITAHTDGGIVKQGTAGYAMLSAFLDACDTSLAVAPTQASVAPSIVALPLS